MGEEGYKGYYLEKLRAGSYQLLSPSGVPIVGFSSALGSSKPRILPLVEGLDCGTDHKTQEQAIKYIVRQYDRMTTTRIERFRRVFTYIVVWRAIAAIAATIAAVMSTLIYFTRPGC